MNDNYYIFLEDLVNTVKKGFCYLLSQEILHTRHIVTNNDKISG